jgi:hypothetical protein
MASLPQPTLAWLNRFSGCCGTVAGGMCAVPAVVNCAEFVAKAAIEEKEYILLGIAKRE